MFDDCSLCSILKRLVCYFYEIKVDFSNHITNNISQNPDLNIDLPIKAKLEKPSSAVHGSSTYIFKKGDDEISFNDYEEAIKFREIHCIGDYRKRRCFHCIIITMIMCVLITGLSLMLTKCPLEDQIQNASSNSYKDCGVIGIEDYCNECTNVVSNCNCPTHDYSLCVCASEQSDCGRGCMPGTAMLIISSMLMVLNLFCCCQLVCQDQKTYNKKKYDIIGIT
jgi:hypothetical protein